MAFETNIIDFDFSDNITNNKKCNHLKETCERCKMCGKKIKNNIGLYTIDHSLIFCDLVCARLYDLNYNYIEIDFEAYRKLYVDKQLTESANKYYNKYKYKFFHQLPIFYIPENDKQLKLINLKEYIKKVLSYKKLF